MSTISQYQLHKNYEFTNRVNIVDYSEFRLKRYISQVDDEQQKKALTNLLADYKAGRVVIAWRRGLPFYNKVINGK